MHPGPHYAYPLIPGMIMKRRAKKRKYAQVAIQEKASRHLCIKFIVFFLGRLSDCFFLNSASMMLLPVSMGLEYMRSRESCTHQITHPLRGGCLIFMNVSFLRKNQ